MSKEITWVDKHGRNRVSLLPDNEGDAVEGIPLDVYDIIDHRYNEAPVEFRVELCKALYARGIIKPSDLQKPGAKKELMRAIQVASKVSANSLLKFIKESLND